MSFDLLCRVSVSTELGNIDPIHEVQALLDDYRKRDDLHFWHHVDAAYGGFLLSLKGQALEGFHSQAALEAVAYCNSITIDPHKLGYVPYACGTFLCRDPRDYAVQSFHSPYIQYQSLWEPGPFTIEGSRSATGPAATWLALKSIGTGDEGYGRIVARTIQLRQILAAELQSLNEAVRVLPSHDTNILCFTVGHKEEPLSKSNRWVNDFYRAHSKAQARFFVSKTALSLNRYEPLATEFFREWSPSRDAEEIHLVRLTLMNPFIRSKEMSFQALDEFCRAVQASLPNHGV